MIKTLVSLDADLASSIALRYVCQMANIMEMDIKTIHVEEPDSDENPPGTGWVRRTWEKGLLETAEIEISQLVSAERASYPNLGSPKVIVGDREDGILNELKEGHYDLLVEGTLLSFSTSHFNKKIRSKLYKRMPCPFLLVRNLVGIKKVALLVEEETELWPLIPTFSSLFKGAELKFDLLHVIVQKPGLLGLRKSAEKTAAGMLEEDDEILTAAKGMLAESEWFPEATKVIRDVPAKIADFLQDYGLVVSCIMRQTARKSPMLELLSRVPSAVLFCWQ